MQVDARLAEVRSNISNCRACEFGGNIRNKVLSEGPDDAKLFIIGDAPGNEEDKSGRPFAGAESKLLNQALTEAGIKREDVFTHNVLSCRPPGDNFPALHSDEHRQAVTPCLEHLLTEINLVRPEAIVILGKNAFEAIYGAEVKLITADEGKVYPLRVRTGDLALATYPAVLALPLDYVARTGGTGKSDYGKLVEALKTAAELSAPATPIPAIFEPGIARLSPTLQQLTREVLRRAPERFVIAPAAQRKNHHPPWGHNPEGGLARHSLAMAYVGSSIVTAMGKPEVADEAFVVGLLHDIIKWGYKDNRGDYQNHPPNAAGLIHLTAARLRMETTPEVQRIVGAVGTHQGQWGPVHPRYWFEFACHCADMIASNVQTPNPVESTLDDLTNADLMVEFARVKKYDFALADEVLKATAQVAAGLTPGYAAG